MLRLKRNISKKDKLLFVIFTVSTLYFVYQHAVNISWDFTVYVSNAKYWAGVGDYYEILRPPLTSFLILIFGPIGWAAAEYLFIVFVSVVFLYSSVRLADRVGVDRNFFYFLSLTPYVIFFGFLKGSDLLSLALLELFFCSLSERDGRSGLFLALSCLTRYNFLIFSPLMLIDRDVKRIVKNILVFGLLFTPWLIYNLYSTGNMLTSLADSYALNIKFRYYVEDPIRFYDIVTVFSSSLPVFVLGLVFILNRWKISLNKSKKYFSKSFSALDFLKTEKYNIFFLLMILVSFYQFCLVPYKHVEYLLPLSVPIAYFSTLGLTLIEGTTKRILILSTAFIILAGVLHILILSASYSYESGEKYKKSIDLMDELGICHCTTSSNGWAILNYMGKSSEPFPRKQLFERSLEKGDFIVLFYHANEPEYVKNSTFLYQFPVINDTEEFILIGDLERCNTPDKIDKSYLSSVHEIFLLTDNVSININPCFIVFERYPLIEKSCNFLNTNGFKLDENRIGVK